MQGTFLCSAEKRQSPSVSCKTCLYLHLPLQGLQEAQCAHDTWQFTAMLPLRSSDSALGQPACIICPPMWHTMFPFPGKPLYLRVCLAQAAGQLLDRCAGDHHAAVLCENEPLHAHFQVHPDKQDVPRNSWGNQWGCPGSASQMFLLLHSENQIQL